MHIPLGSQIVADLFDCDEELLKHVETVEAAMIAGAIEGHATIVSKCFKQFDPFGVSGVLVIAESHIAIHTWPEHKYAAIDIFTCGNEMITKAVADELIKQFKSTNYKIHSFERPYSHDECR